MESYTAKLSKSNWQAVVAHTCNPNIGEVQSGGIEVQDWATRWLSG